MRPPSPQFLHDIRESVEAYADQTLKDGDRGGVIGIATTTGINLALVQRIGGKSMVVGFVGKNWGEPITGGVEWRLRW